MKGAKKLQNYNDLMYYFKSEESSPKYFSGFKFPSKVSKKYKGW